MKERISEIASAMPMVIARGANIFPSMPSSESSGMKTRIMMPTPKSTGVPTSAAASRTIRALDSPDFRRAPSRAKVFSTTTTEPSTMMPMAIAKPPKDIRFAEIPCCPMTMKVINGVRISVATTITELRTSPRKTKSTTITRMMPSTSTFATLSSAASTRSVRS